MKSESHGVERKRSKRGGFIFSQGKIEVRTGSRKDSDEVLSRKLSVGAKALGGCEYVTGQEKANLSVVRSVCKGAAPTHEACTATSMC